MGILGALDFNIRYYNTFLKLTVIGGRDSCPRFMGMGGLLSFSCFIRAMRRGYTSLCREHMEKCSWGYYGPAR